MQVVLHFVQLVLLAPLELEVALILHAVLHQVRVDLNHDVLEYFFLFGLVCRRVFTLLFVILVVVFLVHEV